MANRISSSNLSLQEMLTFIGKGATTRKMCIDISAASTSYFGVIVASA
ncbi:6470_t:CDS:1, partial [Dentiscutata erythropus]